ncbi:MAG TPA: hypothetical protein VKT29_02230 [Terriglobales bacterium]|nr:hypothetical protein [Terriglobales bacterium]
MKPKILLICALLAFFFGLGMLVADWQGSSSFTAAWPVSSSVVQLSGSAKGWRAMAGLAGLFLAPVLLLWALISLATRGRRRNDKEALPPTSPSPEIRKQAASQ